jgi:2-keto-4-pentenoate hydratase/2-oxohepta-3-ene-1,7-dioic acid hydratase in catechol pathway
MRFEIGKSSLDAQRIFCIGRNYALHAAELGNAKPAEPIVFMKPATCLVAVGSPLPLPRGRGAVHHEAEVVLLLDGPKLAGVTLGLDLTLREEQDRLKKGALPWELAKCFDHSAPIGAFVAPDKLKLGMLGFEFRVGGQLRQSGNTADMLFPIPKILEFLASRWTLLPGDLVYTGTPPGVAPIVAGDELLLEAAGIGRFKWKCE